jgi:hypothetical protein
MGYDLTVTRGNVRLAESQTLIRELLEFAAQMELEIIPINWMISGVIPDMPDSLRAVFEEASAETMKPLVLRPTVRVAEEHGGGERRWFSIEREHVQGVVFSHHYEEWILTWNVSRDGLLGRYFQIPGKSAERLADQRQVVSPKRLLSAFDDFINSEPIKINGEISEDNINIHCPWRRSDAEAACDVVKLLSRHCDDLEARDDMGVWPDKDFTRWVNFANKYAQTFGNDPVHPDPTDDL